MKIGVQQKIIPKLSALKNSLTIKELKILDYIINNSEEFLTNPIKNISDKAEVGEATIIRFIRKIGFEKLGDFKNQLFMDMEIENNKKNKILDYQINDDDISKNIAEKIYYRNFEVMKQCLALFDFAEVEKAINYIYSSKKVLFFGVGFSKFTSMEASYKFLRIGINASSDFDSQMMKISASLLSKEDVAIGISQNGNSSEVISSLKIAKELGAKTIAITHYKDSPVTKFADIIILNGSDEGPLQGGAFSTKIAQLFVIDILYAGVVLKNKERAEKYKKLTTVKL
ncbi:MAG: MurR/RpiR family transcriptional regulator [Fusobacteriaceae bacterium]